MWECDSTGGHKVICVTLEIINCPNLYFPTEIISLLVCTGPRAGYRDCQAVPGIRVTVPKGAEGVPASCPPGKEETVSWE